MVSGMVQVCRWKLTFRRNVPSARKKRLYGLTTLVLSVLNVVAAYYMETSLSTYKSIRRQIPEYGVNDLVVTSSDATCRYGRLQGKHHCVFSFVSLSILTAARSAVTVECQRKAKNRMCGGSCCI